MGTPIAMEVEVEQREGVVQNYDQDGDLYVALLNGGGVKEPTSADMDAVCAGMLGLGGEEEEEEDGLADGLAGMVWVCAEVCGSAGALAQVRCMPLLLDMGRPRPGTC